ncbi:uncharacterized protein LOC142170437 [Nicotiana tabacum]|uniref:Uncharacterized protein LOC142170437 n=1 Tax=Nicotiana tabacum TaxID=4097 RepID=A0AC58STZ0_TOBAC
MEVYIDDTLVKSLNAGDHLKHLQETFDIMRKYNIKLNPEKCAFKVGYDKFLGFLVSQRRIEVNPDKFKAIEDISDQLPSVKEVQRLTERLAALRRFISRSSEKFHHFFSLLKKKNDFVWTPKCQQAPKDLKRYLSSPPLLSKPGEGEQLLICLAVLKVVRMVNCPYSKEENVETGALANLGSSTEMKGSDCSAVVQLLPSVLDVDGYYEVDLTNLIWDWRNGFIEYLRHGALEADYMMMEVHEGVCGNHSCVDSVVLKLVRAGYYWPRMEQDEKAFSANGQAESTNKVILQNHKRKLEYAKGKWPDELLGFLWSYRTTANSSMGQTPFLTIYGSEALILVEVGELTLTFFRAHEEANYEALLIRLDLLEEHRDLAYVRMVAKKQRMERYYNCRENFRYFKVGDLVLRKVTRSAREVNAGKLGTTWEGPYQFSAITGKGSYELENQDRVKLPRNWNVTHLKRYYC